jgi:hypothetical protein
MEMPARMFALLVTATLVACAGVTLLLLAAR